MRPAAVGPQATSLPAQKLYLPLIGREYNASGGSEWTQHAHDAQRTSYTGQAVPTPWRWKWAWNGPDGAGAVAGGKIRLPRNSQPVTGGGRVYIAAGASGVYALSQATGVVLWNRSPGGDLNSTPAYDAETGAVFVVSANGTLYKLDAASGATLGQVAAGGASALPLPPAILPDRVLFAQGSSVYAVQKTTLAPLWTYAAGAPVQTPPAYSAARNRVVVVSSDLYVHAINNTDGTRAWRVKPTVRAGGNPGASAATLAEAAYGWPVIAEAHGYVLVKLRLDWQALWVWSPWPGSNAAMRADLQAQPAYQALFVLSLDAGAVPFIANVGHGGFGDGGYLPMGPQPVVKRLSDGQEVAYVAMRGSPCSRNPCDGRWDSHLGELLLDDTAVAGYQAGDVRYIQNTFFPTDEQVNLSMAGDQLLGGHWEAGLAQQILDRSPSRGSGLNPITVSLLPHLATSQDQDLCGSGFSPSHYCGLGLYNTRQWPAGFYNFWKQGPVYDQYWSGYATWVVSNGLLLYVSTDGTVTALEAGNPASQALPAAVDAAPAASARPTLAPAAGPISGAQAAAYAGRTMTVAGEIRSIFNNGKAVYLGFQDPHQGAFTILIPKAAWARFGAPPESGFTLGQPVRVTGLIQWYQGDPVISVSDPAQIMTGDD